MVCEWNNILNIWWQNSSDTGYCFRIDKFEIMWIGANGYDLAYNISRNLIPPGIAIKTLCCSNLASVLALELVEVVNVHGTSHFKTTHGANTRVVCRFI